MIQTKSVNMKLGLTFSILLFYFVSYSQIFHEFYLPINNFSLQTCEYDPTQMIISLEDWEVYQTLNGEWDGPRDSSICINFEIDSTQNFERYFLPFSELNLNQPLFMKKLFDDNINLDSNSIYNIRPSWHTKGDVEINLNNDCPNDICSGMLIGLEIPDSTNTTTFLEWHQYNFNNGTFYADYCLVSEKFTDAYLKEFIYKFSFQNAELSKQAITFSNIRFFSIYKHLLTEIIAEPIHFENNEYNVPIEYVAGSFLWFYEYLVLHNNSTYPSTLNPYYLEALPLINPEEKATINLIISEWLNLHFQPDTYLRGALVEGSDSLRHEFNLVNNGGTFCPIDFVEIPFTDGNSYIHNAGKINFSGQTGCMMFYDGGTLEIGDNTTLNYGNVGQGILMLGKHGTIKFGKNSKLIVDNHFKLWETSIWPDEQVYIELNKGNELIFGKYARLSKNTFQENGHMKLNVYMNGGILDDSNLTPEERQLINRIYPEETVEIPTQMEVQLFPNPTSAQLHLSINTPVAKEIQVSIFSLEGKLLWNNSESIQIGQNEVGLPTASLAVGMYFVKIENPDGKIIVEKFVKN